MEKVFNFDRKPVTEPAILPTALNRNEVLAVVLEIQNVSSKIKMLFSN